MYELKVLLPTFDIELPTCMYSLRGNTLPRDTVTLQTNMTNLNGTKSQPDVSESKIKLKSTPSTLPLPPSKNCVLLGAVERQIQQILKGSSNASEIELRQEKVLRQLNELKSQLAGIRSQLGLCQKGVQHTTPQSAVQKDDLIVEDPLPDIVINAHPNFIPYALLALKNAWSGIFNIDVKVFAHSTVPDIGEEAKDFQTKLCAGTSDPSKRGIKVTLIWTDCEHTEMVMSPTMYVPIYGEVNIIRYLGRVGPAEYRYETSPICNEVDLILDICYQLLRCNTSKAKADTIRVLNSRLQKEQFFGGGKLSVADIGVYSSLVRMKFTPKELTPALKEWRERVKAVILV